MPLISSQQVTWLTRNPLTVRDDAVQREHTRRYVCEHHEDTRALQGLAQDFSVSDKFSGFISRVRPGIGLRVDHVDFGHGGSRFHCCPVSPLGMVASSLMAVGVCDAEVYNELTGPYYRACKDVIVRLLDKNELTRLGSKSGASEVKQHKWFSKINWGLLRNTQPPVSLSFMCYSLSLLAGYEGDIWCGWARDSRSRCWLSSNMWFSTFRSFATKGPGMMG